MGEMRNDNKIFVGKPEGKIPHGRQYIKMDHEEIGWKGVDCVHLTHGKVRWQALVNTITRHLECSKLL
jgi:hypothetical protein